MSSTVSVSSNAHDDLLSQLEQRLGQTVLHLTPVEGGGNNRLFSVTAADGARYALKTYLKSDSDTRDRQGAEFGGLSFLAQRGELAVPRAVLSDAEHGFALYQWVDGQAIAEVAEPELDQALGLTERLKVYSRYPEAEALPLAAEGCLSGAEIVAQVQRRYDRLKDVAPDHPELAAFLDNDFAPVFSDLMTLAESYATDLEPRLQTLSSSDFGFHNALRRADKVLVFVDFEYFGWDDPVKLVADFILHPAMNLEPRLRKLFVEGAVEVFEDDPDFEKRFMDLSPLYGCRWCMILLNEYLPERWQRRAYAGASDRDAALQRQLDKAKGMLQRTLDLKGGSL